ncbi:ABC-F family ATP-binding cassette domain-containing protein [Anaerosacchariphilus polymeriproducens]|uniref:ABC transporter ATP-binding protein n=1 Tax=Anaerosacchariphilus polymeriproducens TaxID=1812858 RepID=A0A371AX30_9FIRM|nr:ABC-F family ATP-binding cassette domain-containing protein [Anaerosacchariphilus polymeriproducens]RDU24030.1 ABC transporter ATP-binding protein [Anaerosacchariphilus polymeriproducens]
MNIILADNIVKGYSDRILLNQVTFGIHQNDKIGVVGINGTGKTTFLKILAKLEQTDSGNIIYNNNITVTYLPQNPVFETNCTILEYILADKNIQTKNWNVEGEAKSILNKLGFWNYDQSIEHLSGGEKKRIALAKAIVLPSDVLILDEPTNHLDLEMIDWLENYLKKFRGAFIMVTHDRYFLDRVTNKMVEIDQQNIYNYNTNYSGFVELRRQRMEMEAASDRKRQSILKTELEWLKRGARARSTKQKARIERIDELQQTESPKPNEKVEIDSLGSRLGKKTIELTNISKAFPDKTLIHNFTHIFLRDERVGFIGPNGCGKSTLMKILIGNLSPDSGNVEIGSTIKIGYFAQEIDDMDSNLRVIDYIKNEAEYITTSNGTISASQMLERFLFTPSMQWTPISKLSGGEKRRLYLLKVLMTSPNVLILDEPTNDLDIATLTILEDYLDTFQGIVITISHDRYFLDRIVDRIFAFEANGDLKQYEGGYSDYYNTANRNDNETLNVKEEKKKSEKTQKPKVKKLKFTFQEQREFDTIDDDIAVLENNIQQLETEMEEYASQYTKLNELMNQKKELEVQLEVKYERWVYLNDLDAKINSEK